MRVYVDCVGCEQREFDAQRCINTVIQGGGKFVSSPDNCQVAVVITCAVSGMKEQLSLRCLSNVAARMPMDAKLIVGGCLPKITPELLEQFPVVATFSPQTIEKAYSCLYGEASNQKNVTVVNRSIFDYRHSPADPHEGKARVQYEAAKRGFKIEIARGCRGRCSYCAIRNATGALISSPVRLILAQIESAVTQAEPTVMLMAGDAGDYGQDKGGSLPELLARILDMDGSFDLYVHDLGPKAFIRDCRAYLEVLETTAHPERLRAICVPSQSGSDSILRLMNREHKTGELLDAIGRFRQVLQTSYIGTHILVGFPGETEHDFKATLDFIRSANFDFLTCFAYSERPIAPSFKLYPKVSKEDIEERLLIIKENIKNAKIVR